MCSYDTLPAHLLQADFVLVASRESVQEGKPWNSNLRDGIAHVFLHHALPAFKQHPQLSATFLAYVPLPGEVQLGSFYGPVAQVWSACRVLICSSPQS
jgi:hypothetical protein